MRFTPNRLAALVLILLLTVIGAFLLVGWQQSNAVLTLVGYMPEAGGWDPGNLKAVVGEPLHLRLTSGDVVHGFAIGKQDLPNVTIHPGEVHEVTLFFEEPGTYTYYCTRWCGANHWRMRGTIEVSAPGGDFPAAEIAMPLFQELGLNLDDPHPAAAVPSRLPSAAQGSDWLPDAPQEYTSQDYYRSRSPAQVWLDLRGEGGLVGLDDDQLWDLVAALWRAQATSASLAAGQALYAENCAACHGENGQGEGVFAQEQFGEMSSMEMLSGHETVPATDFTNPETMLGASPALLQGKIVRGGMGTGMPYWGSIFTDEQTWALVDYLWTFQFDNFMEVDE